MVGAGGAWGEGKKMRSKRSLGAFMTGIVGQRKGLELILSETESSWWVKSEGKTRSNLCLKTIASAAVWTGN